MSVNGLVEVPDPVSPNPVRGEQVVELGGVSWVCRPSWEAIVRIETALGAEVQSLSVSVLGLSKTTRILYECMVETYGENAPGYKQVGQWLYAAGVQTVITEARTLVSCAFGDEALKAMEEDAKKEGSPDSPSTAD